MCVGNNSRPELTNSCASPFLPTVDNKDKLERSSGLKILQAGVGSVSDREGQLPSGEMRRCVVAACPRGGLPSDVVGPVVL